MIANYFKTNWKDMLSVLFFLICYATSILLFLGGVKDPAIPSDLDFPAFLPCAIADIIFIGIFVLIENKVFKMKINIPLIIILSCLFIVNLVVIITTPLVNTFEYVYRGEPGSSIITITNEWKVMYVLCFFLLLMNVYISFNYLIQIVNFKKHFVWICLLCVSVALFLLIYSYIAEWETYKLFLENISETTRLYNPKSLTNNSNNYAAILLGAGFCCYALYAATKKHIFWIAGLFFCVNTLFPMSRICFVLSILLTIMFFLYVMIVSWKNHKFRNANLIFLFVTSISIFAIMCFNVSEIRDYIENSLLIYSGSANSRKPLWGLSISITQGFHRYIGLGHGYFNSVFFLINEDVKMPHNLYLQTYASLGILGLCLFSILICFAIYKIIRLYKNNRDASLISIIGLIIVLSYYIVEG